MCDDVRNLPSLPAMGESLTLKVMEIVGGSSCGDGIGSVTLTSQTVSETYAFTPAIVTMSPVTPGAAMGKHYARQRRQHGFERRSYQRRRT